MVFSDVPQRLKFAMTFLFVKDAILKYVVSEIKHLG